MATTLLRNFKFKVTVGNLGVMGFQKCSGLSSSVEVIEYREGGDAITTRKFPGQVSFGNITLERGMLSDNQSLRNWLESILDVETTQASTAAPTRQSLTIEVLDNSNQVERTFRIKRAFVASREITDLDATGNEILIETLEIAHEGLKEENIGTR